MVRTIVALTLLAAASPLAAQATQASLQTPPARQLFERDWVLMNWALQKFDMNRDTLLNRAEASAAAEAFRKLADANGDGRVTPEEYDAARKAILSSG